jgi:hypothetical protein
MLHAAHGCMLYLDLLASPMSPGLALADLAWRCLAGCLCGLAEDWAHACGSALTLPPSSMHACAGPSSSAAEGGPGRPLHQTGEEERGPAGVEGLGGAGGAAGEGGVDGELSTAAGRWAAAQRAIEARAYWWEWALALEAPSMCALPRAGDGGGGGREEGGAGRGAASWEEVSGHLGRVLEASPIAAACCFVMGPRHPFVVGVQARLTEWRQSAAGAEGGGGGGGFEFEVGPEMEEELSEAAELLQHAQELSERVCILRLGPTQASGNDGTYGAVATQVPALPPQWKHAHGLFPAALRRGSIGCGSGL